MEGSRQDRPNPGELAEGNSHARLQEREAGKVSDKKAYVWVLDRFLETDEAHFGLQDSLNIIQAALELEQARKSGERYFAIFNVKKAYDKVARIILVANIDEIIPEHIMDQIIVLLMTVEMTTANDYMHTTAK